MDLEISELDVIGLAGLVIDEQAGFCDQNSPKGCFASLLPRFCNQG
jgi:hypothetical protein